MFDDMRGQTQRFRQYGLEQNLDSLISQDMADADSSLYVPWSSNGTLDHSTSEQFNNTENRQTSAKIQMNGLNCSGTSSTGLAYMNDYVSKLVEDDPITQGTRISNSGTDITLQDDNLSTSDVFSFDGSPGGMNFNNYVWGQNGSSGGGTSTPSTRSDHNSTSYGSLERTKPSDYGWGEPHYNDSSADSSGYGAETTPGFDSLLSSTPEANNPGWSRNLTREFEQEATKAPSTAGQTQFYGGGPAKRQDERDHMFGALPTGGTEHAPFDMMDGGGPQKLPGFETGIFDCDPEHQLLEDNHGLLDNTEQFLNQCDLSTYNSSPQTIQHSQQQPRQHSNYLSGNKMPRQQQPQQLPQQQPQEYTTKDRILLEALLTKLEQSRLQGQPLQSESPELCPSPSSPWGTPTSRQGGSPASPALQQGHYQHQTQQQSNQRAYSKKIQQQIIAQKFQQMKANKLSPYASNNPTPQPPASSSPSELSAALQTQLLQQQHKKLQQQQQQLEESFMSGSEQLTPDRNTPNGTRKSGLEELAAQQQNQQELAASMYAASMAAQQQQNAAQLLGHHKHMNSPGLKLPTSGSPAPNPMVNPAINPAMYQAQLAAAQIAAMQAAQRGHLPPPPQGVQHPTEGMEGFYPQQYDPIAQMRLNMLGQQEMFDPAYLAAQAAAVAGMTQGTPGARHPMFPFPPMYSTAYRASRRSGPSNELHVRLEECYEQFKNLEKERKKTEAELARQNAGKNISSTNSISIPRLPSNPSRVDRLVVDSLRERAKVITLISHMEKLTGAEMHSSIHTAMDTWISAIMKVKARRKEEIINATNRHRSNCLQHQEKKDVLALAVSIEELMTRTRRARTAMWCALQSASQDLPQDITYTVNSTPNCDSIVVTPKKLLPSFNLKALAIDKEIDLLKSHPNSSVLDDNIDSDGEEVEGTSRNIASPAIGPQSGPSGDSNNNCTKIDGPNVPSKLLQ